MRSVYGTGVYGISRKKAGIRRTKSIDNTGTRLYVQVQTRYGTVPYHTLLGAFSIEPVNL